MIIITVVFLSCRRPLSTPPLLPIAFPSPSFKQRLSTHTSHSHTTFPFPFNTPSPRVTMGKSVTGGSIIPLLSHEAYVTFVAIFSFFLSPFHSVISCAVNLYKRG